MARKANEEIVSLQKTYAELREAYPNDPTTCVVFVKKRRLQLAAVVDGVGCSVVLIVWSRSSLVINIIYLDASESVKTGIE